MYSITEIKEILANAQEQELEAPDDFWASDLTELQTILNGYGPDSWCEEAREKLTWIYRYYQESAGIHDVRYEYSTGNTEDQVVADEEFLANLRKQWAYRYGWSRWGNPVAIWGYVKIRLAYRAVNLWGSESYQAAYNEKEA